MAISRGASAPAAVSDATNGLALGGLLRGERG